MLPQLRQGLLDIGDRYQDAFGHSEAKIKAALRVDRKKTAGSVAGLASYAGITPLLSARSSPAQSGCTRSRNSYATICRGCCRSFRNFSNLRRDSKIVRLISIRRRCFADLPGDASQLTRKNCARCRRSKYRIRRRIDDRTWQRGKTAATHLIADLKSIAAICERMFQATDYQ